MIIQHPAVSPERRTRSMESLYDVLGLQRDSSLPLEWCVEIR